MTAMFSRMNVVSSAPLAVCPKCFITWAKALDVNSHQLPRWSLPYGKWPVLICAPR